MNGENIDIKYVGIPNVCFSITDQDDEREIEFSIQRKERGFDESETWSFYITISEFILPRLKEFNEVKCCFPCNLSSTEWTEILNKMIVAFEFIAQDGILDKEQAVVVGEGLDLFRQYFFDLWW